MSAKLDDTLKTTSYANQISAQVISSLETMVEKKIAESFQQKLTEASKPTNDLVESLQKQLSTLTANLDAFMKLPPHPPIQERSSFLPKPPQPPQQPQRRTTPIKVADTNLQHSTKHIEKILDDFISEEEEKELMDFFELETFTSEGEREVVQYGEHYRYMGSKTLPKAMPEPVTKLLDKLNSQFGSANKEARFHYKLNSCLVNRYDSKECTLPEHADNEGDIDPKSSILTISLGAPRHLQFRDLSTDKRHEVKCNGRSLYEMTRQSQDFFKHSMAREEDDSCPDGIRLSLTFRAIHWSNFNSTALVGDSNFGQIKFGTGRGKLGESTPGCRFWNPTIADIKPLEYTSYRNVVIMVGTNDLKHSNVTDQKVKELYKMYKTKVSLIRKYNSKCKIYICPVLPTKSHDMNRRIFMFNRFLYDDLCQSDLKVILVEGFIKFLDKRSNLLNNELSRPDVDDLLHLNERGTSVLVKLVKHSIFHVKFSNRLYANVLRGGPADPV